ncbi:hypothetical protein [Endozoicomonas elysicola]|uniref:Uncharacterized protein n=1 Tax=Endozoicomonas elysicola TaxID=305900 RepID=A0A081KAM9_9GAMM|nr:hypothetical protein [Endozoicomonas elysicola]KEI71205.1 hypothetical protein GV64_11035 [Endozoicomonas elysicola]
MSEPLTVFESVMLNAPETFRGIFRNGSISLLDSPFRSFIQAILLFIQRFDKVKNGINWSSKAAVKRSGSLHNHTSAYAVLDVSLHCTLSVSASCRKTRAFDALLQELMVDI